MGSCYKSNTIFKKKGIDLEPEIQTADEMSEYVHSWLGTYQEGLDNKFLAPKDVKKFSINNLRPPKESLSKTGND